MRKSSYMLLLVSACFMQVSPVFSQVPDNNTVVAQPPGSGTPPPAETAPPVPAAPAFIPPAPQISPEELILQQVERDLKEKYRKEIYIPPAIQSLVFSPDQQALLREARGGFNTQTPTEEKAPDGEKRLIGDLQDLGVQPTRAISLGGIVFLNPDDWTIWLNKKRVTAAKLPKEAIDLRVYKDFIELRWFDVKSNKIFPIRLRPNQTFNLDAQTFIPG